MQALPDPADSGGGAVTGTARLQVGGVRPDGTRPVTGTDDAGLLLRGEVGPEPYASGPAARPLTAAEAARIVAIAGRAPSVHNTQPWRFRESGTAIDLLADYGRQLTETDPAGRELLISCGAAVFGLRLGFRSLGRMPAVDVLPARDQPALIAHVRVAGQAPVTRHESELLTAVYHRHTHRGPFTPGEIAPRLVEWLRTDAITERAELVVLADPAQTAWVGGLVRSAAAAQAGRPEIAAELRRWARSAASPAHDGVPAFARGEYPAEPAAPGRAAEPEFRLPQRDFGEPGTAPGGGSPPALTAVLTTAGDSRADWIAAGQALHRILLHAATRWVFASLQSQPLELPELRAELRARLDLPGMPQMLLQLGRSNTAGATPRRPVTETLN